MKSTTVYCDARKSLIKICNRLEGAGEAPTARSTASELGDRKESRFAIAGATSLSHDRWDAELSVAVRRTCLSVNYSISRIGKDDGLTRTNGSLGKSRSRHSFRES